MKNSIVIFLLIISASCLSQIAEIEWENTIGGDASDIVEKILNLPDGGFLIGSTSYSGISGDKTEPHYGTTSPRDYWLVKLNSDGVVQWDVTIGGSRDDYLKDIAPTSDGGFVIAGYSNSSLSNDKTEINYGNFDIWIVKIDSLGEIQWQNSIGEISTEYCEQIAVLPDGNFMVFGQSNSDAGFDKSEDAKGGYDLWILKLSSTGEIIWDKTIGGNFDDVIIDMEPTADSGYLIASYSNSGISGNKTSACYGLNDYWAIKIDESGNIIWQKTIGGAGDDKMRTIRVTTDGNYFVTGWSNSGISGNKTEECKGNYDYWILKLNETGEILWQNTIGGTNIDVLQSGYQEDDGGFLLFGYSYSNIGHDKITDSYGGSDYWLVKVSNFGVVEDQKLIGGTLDDFLLEVSRTIDGSYIFGGHSISDSSFDKSEDKLGSYDMWIVKLMADSCVVSSELCNGIDENCNGLIDDGVTESISISGLGPTTFCQGGNVLLTASYSGATLQWKKNGTDIPGATSSTFLVTSKGTYTCETTSACGTALSSGIFVNVQKNPPATITAGGPTTFCAGGSVILTANAGGGLSYQWYKGASLIAGATSINYTATTSGNYKCRVTKTATECFKNSNPISVSVQCKEGLPAGEAGEMSLNENLITIAPNPNNGTFILDVFISTANKLNTVTATIEIFNPLSQLIFTQQLPVLDNAIHENISINNLAAGIYQVKIIYAENSWTQQLIIHN